MLRAIGSDGKYKNIPKCFKYLNVFSIRNTFINVSCKLISIRTLFAVFAIFYPNHILQNTTACFKFMISCLTQQEGLCFTARAFFANQTLISQTADRLPVKYISGWVLVWHKKWSTRYFYSSPNFYRDQKVRNSASIFDRSRLWSVLVSKQSNLSDI